MDTIQTYQKEKTDLRTSASTRLSLGTGLTISAILIAYFFVMASLGLHKHLTLRAFNLVPLIAGIIFALNRYSKMRGGKIEYFKGIRLGMMVTAIATLPFAVFLLIYLNIDTDFMNYLIQHMEMGKYLSPPAAAIAAFIEGLSTGFIATFVAMPYYKKQ
ncbi:MAG TPA: DUF4199 domain-containing protein [Bacteroidia bacterium]|jgi:hypothetical protein|nr:DUF4199 domain-containing protein [Bacteroidia bacterium]